MTTASLFPFAPSRGNLFPSHAALSKTAQDTATAAGPGRPPNHSSSRPPSRLSYPSAPPQDPGDRPDAYVPGRPPCGGSDSTATGQSEERGERGKKDRLRRAGRGDDTAERGPATTARAAETGPSRKGVLTRDRETARASDRSGHARQNRRESHRRRRERVGKRKDKRHRKRKPKEKGS